MKIDWMVAILGQLMDKKPEQRRFSEPGLTDDQSNAALIFKEFESGQGLIGVFIAQQPSDGWFFGKRV
jgi:hypothetical protein